MIIYLSINQSINLPTYLPTFLPTYILTYLSIYLPTYLPNYLPIYLPHRYRELIGEADVYIGQQLVRCRDVEQPIGPPTGIWSDAGLQVLCTRRSMYPLSCHDCIQNTLIVGCQFPHGQVVVIVGYP